VFSCKLGVVELVCSFGGNINNGWKRAVEFFRNLYPKTLVSVVNILCINSAI